MGESYGMHHAVVFNTRRSLFEDIASGDPDPGLQLRVGESGLLVQRYGAEQFLLHAFRHAGQGLASEAELALLRPFESALPPRVFTHPCRSRKLAIRAKPRNVAARRCAAQGGRLGVKDFDRVHTRTGQPLRFEFVISFGDYERMLVAIRRRPQAAWHPRHAAQDRKQPDGQPAAQLRFRRHHAQVLHLQNPIPIPYAQPVHIAVCGPAQHDQLCRHQESDRLLELEVSPANDRVDVPSRGAVARRNFRPSDCS